MADSNFSVSTEGMAPAVAGLQSLGDRISQITQHLESTLDSLGKPWGEDKNGENFWKQYGTSRDQTLQGASGMADATHGVAKGIKGMMDGYSKIDDHAKETARRLNSDSDGSGGGGGDGYGGGNGDNPPLTRARRMDAMQPRQFVKARRMDALERDRGIPATNADGTPLEPLQARREMDALLPTEPGIPAKRMDALEPMRPLEPLQPAQYDALQPGVLAGRVTPAEPLERGELVEGRLLPETPAHPLLAREEAIPETPAHPLLAREEAIPATPAHRLLAREEAIPATPAHHLLAREEAIPATPAHHVYAREAVEPLQPLQRGTLREGTLLPTHESIPAEPRFVKSVHESVGVPDSMPSTEGRVTYPTHEGTPVQTFERVHEAAPLEPAHRLEPVRMDEPVRPLEPVRMDEPALPVSERLLEPAREGVPAEPAGFAELEPERFTPLEPRIPAVPEQ